MKRLLGLVWESPPLAILLIMLAFVGTAWAAAYAGTNFVFNSKLPGYLNGGGLFIGSGTTSDTANKIATVKRCSLVYDMPSIPALGAGSGCNETASATCTGVVFGDTVLLGVDQVPPTPFNGAPPVPFVHAAGELRARVCNDSTDGGAVDWPDASYTFTWIH